MQTGLSHPDSARGSRSPWCSQFLKDHRPGGAGRRGEVGGARSSEAGLSQPPPTLPKKIQIIPVLAMLVLTERCGKGANAAPQLNTCCSYRGAPHPHPTAIRTPEQNTGRRARSEAERGARQQRLTESDRPSVCRSRGALPGRGLRGGCAAVRDAPSPSTPPRGSSTRNAHLRGDRGNSGALLYGSLLWTKNGTSNLRYSPCDPARFLEHVSTHLFSFTVIKKTTCFTPT